jgi:hypothetical protein
VPPRRRRSLPTAGRSTRLAVTPTQPGSEGRPRIAKDWKKRLGGLVAEALEQVFQEAASPPLPAAAAVVVVAVSVVVVASLPSTAAPLDLAEELLVRIACDPLPLFHEDAVELASVEPHASTLGAGVDQDLGALGLNQPGPIDGAAKRLTP